MEGDGLVRDVIFNWGFEGSQAVPARLPNRGTFEVGYNFRKRKVKSVRMSTLLWSEKIGWTGALLRMLGINFYFNVDRGVLKWIISRGARLEWNVDVNMGRAIWSKQRTVGLGHEFSICPKTEVIRGVKNIRNAGSWVKYNYSSISDAFFTIYSVNILKRIWSTRCQATAL
jgi:hypothetical protein